MNPHQPARKPPTQDQLNMLFGYEVLERFAPDLVQLVREMPDPKMLVQLSEQLRQGFRQLYAQQYRRLAEAEATRE